MSEVVKEFKNGFTTRAIVLSLIIGIVGLYANIATWWAMGITLDPIPAARVGSAFYPPYGLVFLLAIASVFLGSAGLTVQEIVVVNVVAFMAADAPFFLIGYLAFIFGDTYMAKTDAAAKALMKFYPGGWTPGDYNIVAPAWTGRAAVPLGALAPSLAFWMFMGFVYCLIIVFTGAVLRLQFVKKEKLPFPMMVPINDVLVNYDKGNLMSYVKRLPFLAGLVVGGLAGILGALNYIYKFTQVFYAYGQFYMPWIGDLLGAISQKTVGGWWMFIPADVAIFYLAPLDILSSMVLLLVVSQILFPMVAVTVGAIAPGSGIGWGGPFPFVPFIIYYAPVAVGLWAVVLGYKAYSGSISRALSQAKAGEGELSDFLTWGGFIGAWVLWLLLWVIFGGNIIALLAGFIVYLLYTTGITGVNAATGTWGGWGDTTPTINATYWVGSAVGTFSATGAAANTTAAWATRTAPFITGGFGGWLIEGSFHPWATTNSYAMAEPTKTKETDILWAQILGFALVVIIGMPLGAYIIYGTGMGKLPGFWGGDGFVGQMAPWVVRDAGPPSGTDLFQFGVAIVVVGILFFLRSTFSWWFFSPYVMFFYDNMWLLNGGVAWVLKLITLRVFGAKAYEESGVPFAVAFMAGLTLAAMIIMGVNSFTGGISVGA